MKNNSNLKLTLKEIAKKIDGKVIGDETLEVHGVSSFYDAGSDEITFASDGRFLKALNKTRACAVIVPEDFEHEIDHHEIDHHEIDHHELEHHEIDHHELEHHKLDHKEVGHKEEVICKTAAEACVKHPSDDSFAASPVSVALIKTRNPKRKFFRILAFFHPAKIPDRTIAKGSVTGSNFVQGCDITIGHHVTTGDNVRIGDRVHIMHGVYIGDDVVIGNDSIIKPNVTIMERTIIGSRVIIHSGTVIGSDGFGFTQEVMEDIPDKSTQGDISHQESGTKIPPHTANHEKIPNRTNHENILNRVNHEKVPHTANHEEIPGKGVHEKIVHAGFVQIDDDVEIGACNTIDRGTFGRTWIGKGVKTDNLVHIAHNVVIGEHSLIVAQVGIAGSSTIGKRVILAGKAGVSGHLTVGDGAIVGPGAGVLSDVKPGDIVSGIPGMPHKLWLKVASILPKLPEIRKKILSLERDQKKNSEFK
ncbi:MAG: UDP-3-O-(3-hydroxymyristoyl)glucosamine N-acyltransferase [Desulfamplus sp.]|nr:UDP-3-O-(3-hydroxymyristoyl)glucosamine N-acyltransferase [Desulfamplus sp.]